MAEGNRARKIKRKPKPPAHDSTIELPAEPSNNSNTSSDNLNTPSDDSDTLSNNSNISSDASLDKAKFKFPVVPGDTLIFKCELLSPLRRGISHMKAQAYVDGRLTTEAELMAKIIKKTEA